MNLLFGADLATAIKAIIVIGAVAFWLISNLNNWMKKAQQSSARNKHDASRSGNQQEILDEVQEFLRRASADKSASTPPPVTPIPSYRPSTLVTDTSRQAKPKQRKGQRKPASRSLDDVVEAEIVERTSSKSFRGSQVGSQPISRNLENRVGSVTEHEQQFATNVESTFQHSVGHLAAPGGEGPADRSASTVTSAAPNEVLVGLVKMLDDPTQIRQAMLLNEILARPTHRW